MLKLITISYRIRILNKKVFLYVYPHLKSSEVVTKSACSLLYRVVDIAFVGML